MAKVKKRRHDFKSNLIGNRTEPLSPVRKSLTIISKNCEDKLKFGERPKTNVNINEINDQAKPLRR